MFYWSSKSRGNTLLVILSSLKDDKAFIVKNSAVSWSTNWKRGITKITAFQNSCIHFWNGGKFDQMRVPLIIEICLCVLGLNVWCAKLLLQGKIWQYEISQLGVQGHGSGWLLKLAGLCDEWQRQMLSEEAEKAGSDLISSDISDVKEFERHIFSHKMAEFVCLWAGINKRRQPTRRYSSATVMGNLIARILSQQNIRDHCNSQREKGTAENFTFLSCWIKVFPMLLSTYSAIQWCYLANFCDCLERSQANLFNPCLTIG